MSADLPSQRGAARATILQLLAQVGREHSDATVLFHSTIAGLLGLHPTDYKVLGILERTGPLSAGEIARSCGLATASVTDLIDRLERKEFVRRVRDAHDRRRVLVEPVSERVEGARRLFASTRRSLARLYARYSNRELTVIADFLARNAERLRIETRKVSGTRAAKEAIPFDPMAGARRRLDKTDLEKNTA
jgi:DNA-binding MarR family transcriptional regulator